MTSAMQREQEERRNEFEVCNAKRRHGADRGDSVGAVPDRGASGTEAAAFYVCNDWRRLREKAIQLYDGIDIYAYYVQHRIMTADMVHHIEEVEDNWNRRLDISNLIPLSNTNHGIISALYKRDKATKRETQKQLRALIAEHWKGSGGIWNVWNGTV